MRGREGLHDERPLIFLILVQRGCGKEKVPKQGDERCEVKKKERAIDRRRGGRRLRGQLDRQNKGRRRQDQIRRAGEIKRRFKKSTHSHTYTH